VQVVPPQTQRPDPLQLPAVPALQFAATVQRHCPPLHEKPGGQTWPHAPQLAAFELKSVQPAGV
jgi:hypothetical protein